MVDRAEGRRRDTPQFAKVSLELLLTSNGISSSNFEIVDNGGGAHIWLIDGGGRLVHKANSDRAITNASAAPTALRLLGGEPPADAQANAAKQAFKGKVLRRRSGRG